jgi:hypothetical protein
MPGNEAYRGIDPVAWDECADGVDSNGGQDMKNLEKLKKRMGRYRIRGPRALFALAVIVGLGGLPGVCPAAEKLGPARPGGLPEVLASVTILSETAMARESAGALQPAPVISDQGGHARVMLWDELRAPPESPPGANGTVTVTTGGVGGK